jgi:hypothetical protein
LRSREAYANKDEQEEIREKEEMEAQQNVQTTLKTGHA